MLTALVKAAAGLKQRHNWHRAHRKGFSNVQRGQPQHVALIPVQCLFTHDDDAACTVQEENEVFSDIFVPVTFSAGLADGRW